MCLTKFVISISVVIFCNAIAELLWQTVVSEDPLGGSRCLKLTVVAVSCRRRGGRVDVFEVTDVTQQVSVQRIAAVTLFIIQLHMTVLREEFTLTSH